MVQNVAWNQYVLFYFWVFAGTEWCLKSVCIILLLTVYCSKVKQYILIPGNILYHQTVKSKIIHTDSRQHSVPSNKNQYVLFYFWLFDGTKCCLESVCIVLLLTVWWYRMLPGISMYYFTFECLLVHTDSRQHSVPVNSQK
jgi:hypothetical protein